MFQPRVKLEVVRRYCAPRDGWAVFVDIDPSEEGKTGGARTSDPSRVRQEQMQQDAAAVRRELSGLGITVGGNRATWCRGQSFDGVSGDRDIVAVHAASRTYMVVEVEGESSGQPEQKLYKAIGQIVLAASETSLEGWSRKLVIAVYGAQIARHLARASALERLGIAAIQLDVDVARDRWLFGLAPMVAATST